MRRINDVMRELSEAVQQIITGISTYILDPLAAWLDRRSSTELLVLCGVAWAVAGICGVVTVGLLVSAAIR